MKTLHKIIAAVPTQFSPQLFVSLGESLLHLVLAIVFRYSHEIPRYRLTNRRGSRINALIHPSAPLSGLPTMRRLSRGKPSVTVLSSDDEAESPAVEISESEDELSATRTTRKRSAPSSRASRDRDIDMEDDEDSDGEEFSVMKRKAVEGDRGRMFMVAVESKSGFSLKFATLTITNCHLSSSSSCCSTIFL